MFAECTAQIQLAGLFPSLQYWPALRVTYILPPLPEDTAHLTDKPGKKSDTSKSKDSMVVRYGKVSAIALFGHCRPAHR